MQTAFSPNLIWFERPCRGSPSPHFNYISTSNQQVSLNFLITLIILEHEIENCWVFCIEHPWSRGIFYTEQTESAAPNWLRRVTAFWRDDCLITEACSRSCRLRGAAKPAGGAGRGGRGSHCSRSTSQPDYWAPLCTALGRGCTTVFLFPVGQISRCELVSRADGWEAVKCPVHSSVTQSECACKASVVHKQGETVYLTTERVLLHLYTIFPLNCNVARFLL